MDHDANRGREPQYSVQSGHRLARAGANERFNRTVWTERSPVPASSRLRLGYVPERQVGAAQRLRPDVRPAHTRPVHRLRQPAVWQTDIVHADEAPTYYQFPY